MVYEFKESSSFLENLVNFNLDEINDYIKNLSKKIKKLHDYKILHRDIKPSNFLYDIKSKKGWIIDFGLCELKEDVKKSIYYNDPEKKFYYDRIFEIQKKISGKKYGTNGYMTIETLLFKDDSNFKIDVWAIGIIFLQLLFKKNYIFSCTHFLVFNEKNNSKNQINNQILQSSIILSYLWGSKKIEKHLNNLGIYILFSKKINECFDKLKKFLQFEIDDHKWQFIKSIFKLDCKERVGLNELINFLNKD